MPKPLRAPTDFKPQWVAAAAIAGVAADFALRRPPWNNLAGTLLTLALIGGLAASGTIRSRSSKIMLTIAAVLGIFLSLRTDPRLVTANLMAIVGLTVIATTGDRKLFDYRPFQMLRDFAEVLVHAITIGVEGPIELQARSARASERRGNKPSVLSAITRGLILAIPLVLVLGLLLGSADAVFASFFSGGSLDIGGAISHAVLFVIGVSLMALLLRLATAPTTESVHASIRTLGRIETFIVFGSMNLLFALFAVAQVVAKTASGDAVLEAAGLTYKEYARQGFFQLLWVAGITLGVVLSLRVMSAGWRTDSGSDDAAETSSDAARSNSVFRALALVSVALTLVIVGVAFTRLQLYISDDGLTPLRFYSSVFSLWVGFAFVLVAIRVLDVQSSKSWMTAALATSGLVVLLGLNVANPESIIATNNLERNESSILWHVGQLSGDGEAVIADRIAELDPDVREAVTGRLCGESAYRPEAVGDNDGGLFSWNLGRRSAESELATLCAGG